MRSLQGRISGETLDGLGLKYVHTYITRFRVRSLKKCVCTNTRNQLFFTEAACMLHVCLLWFALISLSVQMKTAFLFWTLQVWEADDSIHRTYRHASNPKRGFYQIPLSVFPFGFFDLSNEQLMIISGVFSAHRESAQTQHDNTNRRSKSKEVSHTNRPYSG